VVTEVILPKNLGKSMKLRRAKDSMERSRAKETPKHKERLTTHKGLARSQNLEAK
jgi:hypothetical protein